MATAFCVAKVGDAASRADCLYPAVTFHDDVTRQLDWYLATESRGAKREAMPCKCGGVFISRIDGSLSNVVGLPLANSTKCCALTRDGADAFFACPSPPEAHDAEPRRLDGVDVNRPFREILATTWARSVFPGRYWPRITGPLRSGSL